MFCVSADRKMLPPYTVYKAKHMYPTWMEGGIERAGYNRKFETIADGSICRFSRIGFYHVFYRHVDI